MACQQMSQQPLLASLFELYDLTAISNRTISVALRKMRKAPAESKIADRLVRSYSVYQIDLCCKTPVLHNLFEVREHGTVFLC